MKYIYHGALLPICCCPLFFVREKQNEDKNLKAEVSFARLQSSADL